MSRPSCGVCAFSNVPLKLAFAVLLFVCSAILAPAGRAEDLHYYKNYFVTGDYAVDGVGLYAKGVNGWATGTITPADVPQGADIVAAFLYWETVETTPKPSSMNGYFDFDSTNKPYPIVGEVVGSPNTVPCWSQGGTGGPGTWLRVYRADVLRYLRVDSVNSNVRDVDYTHTVILPDSGINQPGIVPHTEGASLVVVYRILDGKTPYKAVVIYDGAHSMPKGSPAFAVPMGGFYQSAGSGSRMTQIVGNGQPGFAAKLTVNGSVPAGVSADPFVGAQGPRWDNLTFNINLAPNASSLETDVLGGSNQVCLSWGAVLMSTNVVNTDGDGNLDIWKTSGLHLNVGSPATSNAPSVPATFGGCANYPKEPCENLPAMGAVLGTAQKPHKDIFVQIDWMEGYDGHIHSPKLAALQAIAGAFSTHNISVHFDVGNRYQQFAKAGNNYMIVPKAYAQGGHLIQESSLECPNNVIVNPADCEYNTKALGYSVLGWKTGIGAIENGFPMLNVPENFAHDRKDIFHYMLLAHALAGPTSPNTGLPVSPPPSTSGVGDLFGGDVMATLGLWLTDDPLGCTQDDPTGLIADSRLCTNQTGTSLVQAGTLMHELGHNVGLHHGGALDTPNCMVDYPSTMNYLYQTRGLTGPPGDMSGVANGIEHIDYSNGTLHGLNENMLPGTPGLGTLPYRMRYYGPATVAEMTTNANAKANCNGTFPYTGKASVRLETAGTLNPATNIDWSNGTGFGVLSPGLYSEDIDFDGTIGDSVPGGAGFVDHGDWASLNLQQVSGRPNVSGLSVNVGPADISTTDLLGQSVLGQNVLGQNVLGQNVLGQSVLGQNVLGQSVLGQNVLGQNVLGQNVLGQNVLGQNVLGEVDYDTAISTLDATGANSPLVGAPSASTGTAYNQVTLTWGLPSLGQIRTYTIYRTNLQAVPLDTVVAGSVSGTPPATAFNDPVTDPNLSDIGANCPSGNVCYDTNYQYFVVATDNSNPANSSTPSNLVTVTVDHMYVTAFTGNVVYGNALPNSMEATISGLPAGGITSGQFTCPTPAPRNVGSYADLCTGPAVGNPATVGVTYYPGVLMITPRPLYIDAVANTKLYDSTTTASTVPVVEAVVANVSGLAYSDTVTGLIEAYQSQNVLGMNGSTLTVTAYTVNDGTGGGNYSVTKKTAAGSITPRPLYIDAATNLKLYDSTTTASATPTVEATVVNVSGLVGTDGVTGLAEAYQSPNVLGANGSTLSVTAYTVVDGNNGGNYSVTATKTAAGTITARPLYIDAANNAKLYDSTTAASAAPAVETTVPNVSGLVGTDSVISVETYMSPNVMGVNGSTLAVTGYTVTDGNSGNNYSVVTKVALGTITQRPLTIDAEPNSKTYDGTTGAATSPSVEPRTSTTGLVGTDSVAPASLTETYASPNVSNSDTLTVSPGYVVNDNNSGGNYTVTLNTAVGVITPATLIAPVTGTSPSFSVGTYAGFQSSDTLSLVVGTLSCTALGPDNGQPTNTPISCSGLAAPNYNIVYSYSYSPENRESGGNAPLTIAVSATETYGGSPVFSLTYSGFVSADSPANVTGTLSCPTNGAGAAVGTALTFTATSPAPICSGLGVTTNSGVTYDLFYVAGTLGSVTPAPLTIVVTNSAGTYTAAASSSGFVNGDTYSSLFGNQTLSCAALSPDTASPANTPISCSGLAAPNYAISYSYSYSPEHLLGDNTAPLTVYVTGTETSPNPAVFTFTTYSGFINGDTPADVAGTLSCMPTTGSNGYQIMSCSGLSAPSSYTILYSLGTVTVQ